MTLKEFIEFISQDGNHFAGFILVLIIIGSIITSVIRSIFKRK
jgi:hypothetical protein